MWLAPPTSAQTPVPLPTADPFYSYHHPLGAIRPGTVLKSRTITYHFVSVPAPVTVTQLLYRTTNNQGRPSVTVASVLQPITHVFAKPRLVSYQYEYDALSSRCDPSYAFSGGFDLGSSATSGEQLALTGYLLAGYTVVTSDYEGERLDFLAEHESGTDTLDGIRAATNYPGDHLTAATPVAMVGYSGGSLATDMAAELARTYAPDVAHRLVGIALGGVPANFVHTLSYIDGGLLWSSIIPMALDGLARGYHLDLAPYLSTTGTTMLTQAQNSCIVDVLGRHPGLRLAQLTKPAYPTLSSIPALARLAPTLVLGRFGTPTAPVLIMVGNVDGTGDLVIVAKDDRTLAQTYCRRGIPVEFKQMTGLEHIGTFAVFIPTALTWINSRFNGVAMSPGCS